LFFEVLESINCVFDDSYGIVCDDFLEINGRLKVALYPTLPSPLKRGKEEEILLEIEKASDSRLLRTKKRQRRYI